MLEEDLNGRRCWLLAPGLQLYTSVQFEFSAPDGWGAGHARSAKWTAGSHPRSCDIGRRPHCTQTARNHGNQIRWA